MNQIMNFELCPLCSQSKFPRYHEKLKPMILADNDKEMHCDVCHHNFKLPDNETLIELAKDKRYERLECYRCGCGEFVPNGEFCIDCDSARDLFEE
jgi:hypothetical protein